MQEASRSRSVTLIEVLVRKRIVVQTVNALGDMYSSDELRDFLKLLSNVSPTVVESAADAEENCWSDVTHKDNCHVLAGASRGGADILRAGVSLDDPSR